MDIKKIFWEVLQENCPLIHNNRLNAVLDVAEGLRNSQNMSLSAIGRKLVGSTKLKHKIKKVDRCLGNKQLYGELKDLYRGLSTFVFEYVNSIGCLVVDLCFLKDDRRLQMLSAQLCTKGRALPIYQEVFEEGELKGRTRHFIDSLSNLIPKDKKVIIVMDAGFSIEWFKAIEEHGWNWICRIRQGKDIKLSIDASWQSVKEFIPLIGVKTTEYRDVRLTQEHEHACRLVTTRKKAQGRKHKISRNRISDKIANGGYGNAAREPWILATNLIAEEYSAPEIVKLYGKRMQVEETFRDIKSHQFGLGGRYVRTLDVNRWAVLMLLASIVVICYWVIGVIGHSQGMQKIFQPNTVKERIYSYFTLGRFIIEYDKLNDIQPIDKPLVDIIREELTRE